MKLIRFGKSGEEKPGLLHTSGKRKDCSSLFADWNREFFSSDGLVKLAGLLAEREKNLPDVADDVRWGPPVARPGKVVCAGLNFSDHAKETGMDSPKEPILFMKASTAVSGPYDDVLLPRGGEKTDWEVEMGVVVGRDARYLSSSADSPAHIAGYTIANDISERAFQLERGGNWSKGKSCDTFCPLGPFLATPDELPDVNALGMTLEVNAEKRQTGNTRTMIFKADHLVWYISQLMTLEAGDIVLTGTPPGVGMGMKPPRYLKEGDVMELSIDGLGRQRLVCRRA